jgi:hypothetical protein
MWWCQLRVLGFPGIEPLVEAGKGTSSCLLPCDVLYTNLHLPHLCHEMPCSAVLRHAMPSSFVFHALRHAVLCHALQVCCKSLAGQSYDTSVAVLSAAAAEALSCCPGLLLLDDLDLLMPAPNTDGPVGLEQVGQHALMGNICATVWRNELMMCM